MIEKIKGVFRKGFICNDCVGRQAAELLSGLTNEERGRIVRQFAAMFIDSGEKFDADMSNFYGMRFRNVKVEAEKPKECKVCKNFFQNEIDKLAERVAKKLEGLEFNSFLIGSIPSGEMMKNEEKMWSETGIEFVEPIKSEINRELGKRVEKLTGKKFNLASPDMTIVVDLGTDRIRLQVKSLYIAGGYKKLVRGIPQTKWLCADCGGKGCKKCKGLGKLYKTSVQEEIEKPLIKAVKAKKSKFHGAGREDIDARCLDYRPFVIELVRPMKRKVDLKKLAKEVNRSKKVKVSSLKLVDKDYVVKIKTERLDKTYMAEVIFLKDIDRKKLRLVKQMIGTVSQQTPARVLHRRADKMRKRMVKSISVKIVGKRKLKIKVKAESGLYIKELMSGDSGRTRTNVADMLNNKVKKISLDVIKIHD
jgi:tRNA pseudouridine synthase 10